MYQHPTNAASQPGALDVVVAGGKFNETSLPRRGTDWNERPRRVGSDTGLGKRLTRETETTRIARADASRGR